MGVDCQSFYLQGSCGPVFAVYHRPQHATDIRGNLLCVPAFNEEANRCRSMVTQQARALTERGLACLVVDLHGTGDSGGEFVDARWDIWLDDLGRAWAWLEQQPFGCRGVIGVRLGALLAATFLDRSRHATRLAMWQPVADGKTHLNQFLRVKIAAQMDRQDLPKASTAQMRADWNAGRTVEVAGYEIHPELAQSLDTARLADCDLPAGTRVLWLESAAEGADLSPATQALLAKWRGRADATVEAKTFSGPAFWQVHERVLAPSVIELTTHWFAQEGRLG